MRPAWRAANRAGKIRRAVRGWRAAGLVDDAAVAALAEEYPSPGPRLGPAWRLLIFGCVAIGAHAATLLGLFAAGVQEEGSVAAVLIVSGVALALLTDVVVDRSAYQPTGAEAATSLLAVSYLIGSAFILNDHFHLRGVVALRVAFAWSSAVLGFAFWRWGFRIYAGAAVVAALLAALQLPGGRLAWTAGAALIAFGAGALGERRELAPSHRDGVALARIVALAAVYVAVNYFSVDKGLLEEVGRAAGAPRHRPGPDSLLFAWVASALFPPALFAWGLRARDRALIDLGIVAAALSLATLRFYVNVPPLWAALAAGGAALAAASLLLERWLRAGRGGERSGFTADPFDDEAGHGRLLPVAAAIAMSPDARGLPQDDAVRGGGGKFGGGGAGGQF